MSNQAKLIRGQVRQIVKELLPEILKAEITYAIRKEIGEQAKLRLDDIAKEISARLDAVDERSKETQSYIVRHLPTAPITPART